MEKLEIRKNPGDILYASDISSIVSTINEIIKQITSNGDSGTGSGSAPSIGDIIEIPIPQISYASYQSSQTPFTPDGYNEKGMPWGIWLLSYLSSDLENPIKERLLGESEYIQYLGSGYNITTNVSITCRSSEFRDELFNESMQISLWPSGSTDFSKANLTKDNYKITGVPRVWDVLVNMGGIDDSDTYGVKDYAYNYRQFVDENEVLFHLDWHDTLYNKAVEMCGPDENPIIGYTGTVTMTTGNNNTEHVTDSVNVPINPARDLSLDHLFVIIPQEIVTWEQFVSDPESYLQTIKANDKHLTITTAQTQYENDVKNVLKETIVRNGTDRFGLNFDTNVTGQSFTYRSTLDNYLNKWQEICRRRRLDLRDRAEDIVIAWFKKYCKNHPNSQFIISGDYGIIQDPGIIWSDIDGVWNSSENRYTGKIGYCYTSTKHMRDIPRFNKLYCLDDISSGYSSGGPTIYKGPIQDVNNCPRFENNIESEQNVIDGSWWANKDDIVVELIANPPENHHTVDYYVMYGDAGQMRTDGAFAEQMFDLSNASEYITSVPNVKYGSYRFYNNHPNAICKAQGVDISLPYEDVVDISTGNVEDDTTITDKWDSQQATGKYFRYGGGYTIFAFKANRPFCIKDIKWGHTETNAYFYGNS